MKSIAVVCALISASLVISCGSDSTGGLDLAPEQSELDQHYGALSSAADVPAATTEAGRHMQAMMAMLRDLRAGIDRASGNGGCMSGNAGVMNTMMDDCGQMAQQITQHKDLISRCADMAAVLVERDRYHTLMDGYMGSMHSSMMGTRCGSGDMMGNGGMGGMMGR